MNWKPPWREMELKQFLKQSSIALLTFTASNFDLWSDAMLASSYIKGKLMK